MNAVAANTVFHSSVTGLEMIHRGKVRDIYAIDADHMLIVTTDRLSAFDVVLPIRFRTRAACSRRSRISGSPGHNTSCPISLQTCRLERVFRVPGELALLRDRSMVVRRLWHCRWRRSSVDT
jgi:phosphoribosylaminoimidazole-succinocarboxamide synthase